MTQEVDLDQMPIASSSGVTDGVPVINLDRGRGADQTRLVAEIATACEDWGFFQIINHGVPEALIADVWTETRRFFAQPRRLKESLLRSRDNPWGYYNNELTKNQRDRKEVFDFTTDGIDPVYRAANRWPDDPSRFREVMEAYRDACEELSIRLLDGIAAAVDPNGTTLHSAHVPEHTGFVRLNYYPVDDPLTGRHDVSHLETADLGVHHHTDAGIFTVLLQDQVGGLQVFRDGYWHDVEPIAGALVINTADMLQVWSNDRFRAPIHRVLAMRQVDRYSIPFFYNPSAGTVVEPLADSSKPHYRPIDWSTFRAKRTDGDYADYGDEVQIAHYRLSP